MTILRRNDWAVMLDKQEISRNAETDPLESAGNFLILAIRVGSMTLAWSLRVHLSDRRVPMYTTPQLGRTRAR